MDDLAKGKSALEQIDRAVNTFLAALSIQEDTEEIRLAVADMTRLLDLRQQLSKDEIREVRVRWVESNPAPFAIK